MAILNLTNRSYPNFLRRSIRIWLLLLVLLPALPDSKAWSAGFNPAQIKAAFIYNLASFVEWPVQEIDKDKNTFVIAVLGDDEIGRNLGLLVEGEQIKGKAVIVKHYSSVAEAGNCRILFVGSAMQKNMAQIFRTFAGRSTLIVSDSDAFIRNGGMVNLKRRDDRIRIEINVNTAKKVGIKFNAKLLKVATIIASDH